MIIKQNKITFDNLVNSTFDLWRTFYYGIYNCVKDKYIKI